MRVSVFKPSKELIGGFDIENVQAINQGFAAFAATEAKTSPYDYLECSGRTWTVVPGKNGLELQDGRVYDSSSLQATSNSPLPTHATHCFIVSGGARQGPYVIEQLRAMWMSGSITADATVEWEGCSEPVPITALVSRITSHTNSKPAASDEDSKWALFLMIVGGASGLLASYLMRPEILGRGPTMREWLTAGFSSPFATTIITCGVIGAVVGLVVGILIDKQPKRE